MSYQAILCVDDEAIIVLALKQELKSRYADRFLYETAMNAEEALSVIADLESEGVELLLVIADWLMPGMKGDALLRSIKKARPEARAIMITGQADEGTIATLLAEGIVDAVVSKPWRMAELFARIELCLQGPNCREA
jgi:Response regulator containing CheY-like receiver, AAA-type ATPase, and DNA-binding domains